MSFQISAAHSLMQEALNFRALRADLVEATRSYQANIAAYDSAKKMAMRAISILQA